MIPILIDHSSFALRGRDDTQPLQDSEEVTDLH